MLKVGLGYDVHRFKKGRKLYLGGIEVPYEMGLEGHSDADVVLHAICDAILGALGKGDIGEHFPNTDQMYKNISSLKLTEHVFDLLSEEGYAVNNVDTVILAEAPNLKEFKGKMRSCIAKVLKADEDCINVKATTGEGMGFIGHKEGMAAYATVTIIKK